MTHLLLLALLAADPAPVEDVGANDVPVLIDERGSKTTITGVEPLALGTVCLTHAKAAMTRDDIAAKNARVATLESGSGIDWPLMAIVVAGAVLVAGAAAVGGYVAGINHR